MASPTKVDLGAFAEGEIPPTLSHQYLDFDGAPVPLTGFSPPQVNIEAVPPVAGTLGAGTAQISDAANGWVTYAWAAADMAEASDYTLQIWVTDGTNKYASDLITYTVYDGPGSAP